MESDSDPCPVCHEAVTIYAIGSCDHPICYRCSVRMRALCGQIYCPICRTDLPKVYMVKDMVKESEIPRYGYQQNRSLKVFFENHKIRQKVEKLLEHKCPKCQGEPFRLFKDLQTHMRKEHSLFYCSLCVDHLKIFSSERKYYNRTDLATHRRLGDRNDSSYKGHPLCQFCDVRYMDNDELFRHLRKDHYYCHFCESDGCNDYYNDYEDLKRHFKVAHYLCEESECEHLQFTHAFRTEIDYKAHITADHNKTLSKAQARQNRNIDIDINLAPRRYGRPDRAMVTGDDYRDTQSSGARGRGSRFGNRTTHKDRFRDEDMEKAIQASLSVMKEESVKKPDSRKTSDEESEKEPAKLSHDEANFPTLGVPSMSAKRPLTPTNHENKDSNSEESLAKKLAKANNMSVQHGRLGSVDFPSLHVQSSNPSVVKSVVPTVNSNRVNSYSRSETAVTNISKTTANSVTQVSKVNSAKMKSSRPKGVLPADDFPELPASSKIVGRSSGMWVKTQPPPPPQHHNTQSQTNMQNINIVKTLPTETKSSVPKPQGKKPTQKVLNDDSEFPTLGGSSDENLRSLFRKTDDIKGKKPPKIDWFDIEENEFSVDKLKGDKDNSDLMVDLSKKSKKKKKKKHKEPNNVGSNQTVEKESCTLDNIASSLLSVTESQSEKFSVKDDISESQDWTPVPAKSNHRADCKSSGHKSKSDVSQVNGVKPSVIEDKAPGVSAVSEATSNGTDAQEKPVREEDFPQLSSHAKAPPPGFKKAVTTTTSPPGFSDVSHANRPPPGFKAAAQAPSDQDTKKLLDDAIRDISMKSLTPMSTVQRNFVYQQPENFQARNKQLISDIQVHLDNDQDSFDKFKAWSGLFRSGEIGAPEYYVKCETLLGKDDFAGIFEELLVLLPDINKQAQLLAAYKDFDSLDGRDSKKVMKNKSKGKKKAWGADSPKFIACTTCQQVLVQKDLKHHSASHDTDSDFPSLYSNSFSSGLGLREWVKAT